MFIIICYYLFTFIFYSLMFIVPYAYIWYNFLLKIKKKLKIFISLIYTEIKDLNETFRLTI